jgi:FixJ family two-component response regulator
MNDDQSPCNKSLHNHPKVFVADDDDEMRNIISDMLSDDYDVIFFKNGKILIDHLKKTKEKPNFDDASVEWY